MPGSGPRKIPVVFYRTLGGAEVVRDWLRPPSRGPRPHARSIPLAGGYAALPRAR